MSKRKPWQKRPGEAPLFRAKQDESPARKPGSRRYRNRSKYDAFGRPEQGGKEATDD